MIRLANYRRPRFRKAKFQETADELCNPERGWYQIHTFNLGEEISMKDRQYTLNATDTLAFVLIDISAYRSKPLDEDAIDKMRRIFDFFREYRLDMIVRVVYDTVGRCLESEPEEEELVLEHMRQLGPILEDYAPEIFVYQGLLIGNWGEMHSSKFLSPTRLRRLAEVIQEELKNTAFLAVRRPAYVRILFPEGADLKQNSVGIFDDAIMASPTHLGTFGDQPAESARREQSWKPMEELKYVSDLCDRVPYGGEALWSDEQDGLEEIRSSLKKTAEYCRGLHLAYLNRVHDIRFLEHLKSQTWIGKDVFLGMNGYDYIGRHLGYRFVLRNVKCEPLKQDEEILAWEIEIENVGFSRAFFETEVYIIGEDASGNEKQVAVGDWLQLFSVKSGEKHTFRAQTERLYGKIYLYVAKKSTGRGVFFANKSENDKENTPNVLLGEIR